MTVSVQNNQLNLLAYRTGYNLALRHFRMTQDFAADVADFRNLADVVNSSLREGEIKDFQIRPVVSILLAEKFGYAFRSENLSKEVEDLSALAKMVDAWTNIQIVLVYTDVNGGVHLINPSIKEHWESVLPLEKDRHLVCYAGSLEDVSPGVVKNAVNDVFSLLYKKSKSIRAKSGYSAVRAKKRELKPKLEFPAAPARGLPEKVDVSQAPVQPPAKLKLTSKIAVTVTNELFHNGNVEAWKRIIESYKYTHPGLDVLIWYEGERINDINALFKWGKVKHGVPIMFSVAGDDVKNVAKLRKYLFEGASPRFENFLHGPPGTVLHLF